MCPGRRSAFASARSRGAGSSRRASPPRKYRRCSPKTRCSDVGLATRTRTRVEAIVRNPYLNAEVIRLDGGIRRGPEMGGRRPAD